MGDIPGLSTTTGNAKEYRLADHFMVTPVTILSGSGAIAKGTLLGKITASAKWAQYVDGHIDGTEVARGIADEAVDAASADAQCAMLVHGFVAEDKLVGFDAAGYADLKGRIVFDKTDLGMDLA